MHVAGINWVAVAAAAAFFAIGFVIHVRLVDLKAWDAAKHTCQTRLRKPRMAAGIILPLVTALGLAILFSWADVAGVAEGVQWALLVAFASALPVLWYNWFYGTAPLWIFAVDSAINCSALPSRRGDPVRLASSALGAADQPLHRRLRGVRLRLFRLWFAHFLVRFLLTLGHLAHPSRWRPLPYAFSTAKASAIAHRGQAPRIFSARGQDQDDPGR